MKLRSLTGIKPTGMPHIGNWLGAIKPALELAESYEALYFIADYHAFTTTPQPETIRKDTRIVAASWLALGLDPGRVIFYRQSDVPQIFELCWFLSCFAPKGFLNRAHGYKDKMAANAAENKDSDDGINLGFYSYPVLMAADILLFSSNVVPVGKDQKQHLEFARDFASRVNHFYQKDLFVLPEAKISKDMETIIGLDGRKMSKSYDNTIPLFCSEKQLKKTINSIVTNSQEISEPKNPDESHVFALHRLFLSEAEKIKVKEIYTAGGMGWGQAKAMFFETLNCKIEKHRSEYERLLRDPGHIESVLEKGAQRAREIALPFMVQLREVTGFSGP
jgi:tryptophanyl-tRNA synthetase